MIDEHAVDKVQLPVFETVGEELVGEVGGALSALRVVPLVA